MNSLKSINEYIGRYISWLIIIMVIVQIVIVLSRYIFGLGFIKLQELMIYMHGSLFTVSAGYTLLYDEHVRVDSIYREATVRYKSLVNIFGTLFLLFPFILVTFLMSFPYVKRSWKILEGSPETSGLNATYLFKTVLIIFPFLLFLQAIVIFTNSIKNLRNEK
tara:strand:+ start:370 stop:858 length:489 start_codon:yes stop_codon:yes gene_type:complete